MGRKGSALTLGGAPQHGWTPLHCAAWIGHPEAARALLEAHADITAKTNVSEGGVGGEGQRIRESRDFERGIVTALGELHTPARRERLLSAPADDARAHQCVDVQGSLLHKMRLSGCWASLWVRGG